MLDDQEVVRAKAVLRNAGYYCIPREKVVTAQVEQFIDELSLLRYGDNPSFIQSFHSTMHKALGIEIMKAGLCTVTSERHDATKEYPGRMGTNYRLKVSFIPDKLITDPMIEYLREKQG